MKRDELLSMPPDPKFSKIEIVNTEQKNNSQAPTQEEHLGIPLSIPPDMLNQSPINYN